jgi:hypothetical protein
VHHQPVLRRDLLAQIAHGRLLILERPVSLLAHLSPHAHHGQRDRGRDCGLVRPSSQKPPSSRFGVHRRHQDESGQNEQARSRHAGIPPHRPGRGEQQAREQARHLEPRASANQREHGERQSGGKRPGHTRLVAGGPESVQLRRGVGPREHRVQHRQLDHCDGA